MSKELVDAFRAAVANRDEDEEYYPYVVISAEALTQAADILERQRGLLARALIVMEEEGLDLCGFPEPMRLYKEIAALQETGSDT